MSAGSNASILGYGNQIPFHNINSKLVNASSTNYPGNFSSNEIPGLPGLSGAKNNVDAAAGILKGGGLSHKYIKRKIKNITTYYKKMRHKSKRKHSIRRKFLSRSKSRAFAGGRRTKRRYSRISQRGGYSQYQNNLPMTSGYSTAGVQLGAADLGRANPPPINAYGGKGCVDNYNHYTNTGFPSKGH